MFAVGLPAVFLVAPVFLVFFAAGFSAFLTPAFLGAVDLVVVFSHEHQRGSIRTEGRFLKRGTNLGRRLRRSFGSRLGISILLGKLHGSRRS